MERIVDTHVHLSWSTYRGQVGDVVRRAKATGVDAMIDLGTDLQTSRQAAQHAETYSNVWFGAGIHPNDAHSGSEITLAGVAELLDHPRCVVLGEIGLDFYREHADPQVQEEWFRRQLQLATEKNKPVVIHDRKASAKLLEVLDDEVYDGLTGPGGVFHCFAGDRNMAQEVVERGFYVSFAGNLTYPGSDRPEVAAAVPLERLLLETDSPFMAPTPRRGRDNEPSYITYVAAAHAAIRDMTLNDIARITTENADRLFGIP